MDISVVFCMHIALIGDSPMGSSDYIILCFLSYVFVYYVFVYHVFCVSFVEFIMCLCILCFVYYVFCLMCFECPVWGAVMRKPLALFASSTGNLPQNVQTQRCNYFLLFHNLKWNPSHNFPCLTLRSLINIKIIPLLFTNLISSGVWILLHRKDFNFSFY